MAIAENEYETIIDDLMYLAETGADEYVDSLAVAYIVMRKLGDRNADSWLMEMKEQGFPIEWESLRDGKQRNFTDLDDTIKNFVGMCVYRNGKLSFRQKWYKRGVKKKLEKEIRQLEETYKMTAIANAYRLASLYTLSGYTDMVNVLIIGDDSYRRLPLYIQWIEKYMWR
jgi:hypothetical protein